MKKIIYSKIDGSVAIVHPAPKEKIEAVLGFISDEEYEKHIMDKSIPKDAINVRFIDEKDIPESREFRNAWTDKSNESYIDICCTKAKEIALNSLREVRNKKLSETDVELVRALENNNSEEITKIRAKRQFLRDATNPLKNLKTDNKINDKSLLDKIKALSKLE